ncbi:MAG: type III secretion T3S chaperone [Simkania sp.]|nr:type III secretion T3S chaperone [Simkania sp.]
MASRYPLEQIKQIKDKRLQEAEKFLREKKEAQRKEEEKLRVVEEERNEILQHREAKLTQFRETLDEGTTTDKIQQMKQYLKVVEEKLKVKEVKVQEQKKQVDLAIAAVEAARLELLKKQRDVEKLDIHQKEWDKEVKAALEHKETTEADEMGGVLHERLKRKKKNNP